MAISYTQGYINEIINIAEKAIGEVTYNIGLRKAFGAPTGRYIRIYKQLVLYNKAIGNYGCSSDTNFITDTQRDLIIEKILKLSRTKECEYSGTFVNCLSDCGLDTLLQDNGFIVPSR